LRYALRRLGFFVVTLWIALTLNFFLPRLMPGNPALAMMSKFHGELSPKALNALEILFGVNTKESLLSQYFGYLHQILTGNFGTSSSAPAWASSRRGAAAASWTASCRPRS
jgi:peptide/nickel transport system permease protein